MTKEGITKELESFQKAGLGGVELTPIFGVIGEEAKFVDFLSQEWMDLFVFSLEESERLGLQVDLATGTGWPFGGPWVEKEHSPKYLAHRVFSVKEGEKLIEKVELIQEPIFRRVGNAAIDYYEYSEKTGKRITQVTEEEVTNQKIDITLDDIIDPIETNPNLQKMAFDQIRFEESLPLISLIAYNDSGEIQDLTSRVNKSGQLDWVAPAGTWKLYAIFQGYHGKMVERAAPGGEGNVIDHFSHEAINDYLDFFDKAFKGNEISSLRAFFNDSYEVDDAKGQSNWTPKLLSYFKENRGYDLTDYLPALLDEEYQDQETRNRVISDYRQTFNDLILETFTKDWAKWAHENNATVRNQSHGSPGNILDLYAASDIPEAEGTQPLRIKFASSAAHVSGKKLAASEAATWLNEHFLSGLSDLKQNIDNYLVNGVNHVVYHGTAYSPDEDVWPGRLFYAAIHMNDRNPMWKHAATLNQYISRTQSVLQSGKPDNDVLLYFPAFDVYGAPHSELLAHFDGHGSDVDDSNFGKLANQLIDDGYELDFISDDQILNLTFSGSINSSGNHYQAIVIPETQFMPLATLEKLKKLAAKGANIVFENNFPHDLPGIYDLEKRQEQLARLTNDKSSWSKVSISSDVSSALDNLQVRSENIRNHGLQFIRREINQEAYYFVTNYSSENFEGWLNLAGPANEIVIMDPMTGQAGLGSIRKSKNGTEVYTKIAIGEGIIFRLSNQKNGIPAWHYYATGNESIEFNKPWLITFKEGGPTLPQQIKTDHPIYWTEAEGIDYDHFSGIATYTTTFKKPKAKADAWVLELGDVGETASIRINGQLFSTLVGPEYTCIIPSSLLKKKNTLEIEVANKMANRIIHLDQNNVFWKRFYNTNFPPRLRENFGPMRIFSAAKWDFLPSGLAGPVTIKSLYHSTPK
ncbi:glycosyl hydrolase family 2 [Portibacter lacus]|uniref:Glycosyl hydrolase family 2 n=1 Tax=Portibacter lacus TaxID=1099794 RepID=A0AA37WFU0_9BACT|nr:glycosyl hydrolase family 2 [Portibacter lacus]